MSDSFVPASFSPTWADDGRVPPPPLADERTMLSAYLDWQRATFEQKCAGLSAAQLSTRTVPPSTLTLHGLLRHLSGVERWWLRQQFAGEAVPMLYYTDEDPDQDFESHDGDTAEALAIWRAECARSREIVAAAGSLEDTGTRRQTGEAFSLRWVLLRLIAEYAQHNGHADLLREATDGRTGG